MELKQIQNLEFKADEPNKIVGYGSIFGNVDHVGDVVLQGAFAESITSGRKVKMLWQHQSTDVIGIWNVIKEDSKGLYMEGEFANTEKAREAKELVKIGAVDGLSIGYKTIDADYNNAGNRLIKKAELWETSIVTFPCNSDATITELKSYEFKRIIEKALRDSGYSRKEALAFISEGENYVKTLRDAEINTKDVSREILESLNTLVNKF